MPRQARQASASGWGHVILRGINREDLFYDDEDYRRFLTTVERYRHELGFDIAILCLMSNHVHFLMREEDGSFAQIIKKIAVSYAIYYNKKYDRVGAVFQDRFRSEPVNDEKYLLTVLRYIYRNPQKAGICPAGEYPYTLMWKSRIPTDCFDTERALENFLNEESDDRCLEYDTGPSLSEDDARELLARLCGSDDPQFLQTVGKQDRDEILRKLKATGVSVRTLSRLTGINRNIIQRV